MTTLTLKRKDLEDLSMCLTMSASNEASLFVAMLMNNYCLEPGMKSGDVVSVDVEQHPQPADVVKGQLSHLSGQPDIADNVRKQLSGILNAFGIYDKSQDLIRPVVNVAGVGVFTQAGSDTHLTGLVVGRDGDERAAAARAARRDISPEGVRESQEVVTQTGRGK